MSKLVEVKMPPLDGTEFIVIYAIDGYLLSENIMIIDSKIITETNLGWIEYEGTPLWDSDLDARYFVAEEAKIGD